MIIRAIDTLGDWTFGKGKQNYLKTDQAIAENIQTRLLCFFHDCFFDYTSGIDWVRLLGTPGTKTEITLSCRGVILQSYGVTSMNSISVSVDSNRRILNLIYNINTIFTRNFSVIFQQNLSTLIGG